MKKVLLSLTIAIFLFAPLASQADIGPKPTMGFDFVYKTEEAPSIVGAKQYQCESEDCSDAELMREIGPQAITCQENSCTSMSYGFKPYQKLVVEFSDEKIRESNVFSTNTGKTFTVEVTDSDLLVKDPKGEANNNSIDTFVWAAIATIILEIIVALIFLQVTKKPKKILLFVLIGNVISLPIVWFVFPLLIWASAVIIIAEIFAVVFEAYFIFLLNNKSITLKSAFLLSVIMNFASLILSLFIRI